MHMPFCCLQLQDLVTTMLEFWNLMDTPAEEQQKFIDVSCNIAATVSEITKPNSLSIDLLEEVGTFTTSLK